MSTWLAFPSRLVSRFILTCVMMVDDVGIAVAGLAPHPAPHWLTLPVMRDQGASELHRDSGLGVLAGAGAVRFGFPPRSGPLCGADGGMCGNAVLALVLLRQARGDALTRQRSRLPPFAMPCRPRNALRASGELAKTLRKFGTMPSCDWIASNSAFCSGVGDFVGDDFDTGHDVTSGWWLGCRWCCRRGPLCQR